MTDNHRNLYERFHAYFPNLISCGWWRKGECAIRVRMLKIQPNAFPEDLIFTWAGDDNWSLMPISVYNELIAENQAKRA